VVAANGGIDGAAASGNHVARRIGRIVQFMIVRAPFRPATTAGFQKVRPGCGELVSFPSRSQKAAISDSRRDGPILVRQEFSLTHNNGRPAHWRTGRHNSLLGSNPPGLFRALPFAAVRLGGS